MFQGQIDQDTAIPVEASAIPDVLFERGLYWASGRSGVVNLVAAHKWFNLAALKGRADAIGLRREVAEMMSEVEIAMAQRQARAWITTHLERAIIILPIGPSLKWLVRNSVARKSTRAFGSPASSPMIQDSSS
jgi:uncharacterized protein